MSKWIVNTGVGIVLAALFVLGIIYLSGSLSMLTADFRGEVQEKERVRADGDYRVANYDMFFEKCSDAKSLQQQIENQEELAAKTDDPDQQQIYESGALGMKQSLEKVVNDYNAKAASEGTRGEFRDSDLPYEIDTEQEIECVS